MFYQTITLHSPLPLPSISRSKYILGVWTVGKSRLALLTGENRLLSHFKTMKCVLEKLHYYQFFDFED